MTISEFDWQGQHCFAYIKHGLLVVFSEHALRRYEERVLAVDKEKVLKVKQIFKILLKYIPLSYRTVLPSPTHPLCYYFVVLNALFLGDFDDSTFSPEQKRGEIWLNTCISLKEAGVTQKGILKTLSLLPLFIKDIGYNPFDSGVKSKQNLALRSNHFKWSSFLCICKSVYLIDKLFVMMDLPVSKLTNNCFYTEMRLVGVYLEIGGIDISKLTPYGKDGIAIRGELDYKGEYSTKTQ